MWVLEGMSASLEAVKKTYFYSFFQGKSKEAEIKRINKELANIRSKFKGKCYPFLNVVRAL